MLKAKTPMSLEDKMDFTCELSMHFYEDCSCGNGAIEVHATILKDLWRLNRPTDEILEWAWHLGLVDD